MTPRMLQALNFIRAYTIEHGYSPSLQEIADSIGVLSKGNAHRLVESLIDLGRLRRGPGHARSIELVPTQDTLSIDFPPELDAYVRKLAHDAQTTPAAIVIECVRDRLKGGTFAPPVANRGRSISVSRETPAPASLRGGTNDPGALTQDFGAPGSLREAETVP